MKDLVIVFQSFCPSQKDLSKSIISRFYFFFWVENSDQNFLWFYQQDCENMNFGFLMHVILHYNLMIKPD